ncbi:ABC transporter substrate-binding protein [Paenarthrobacter ureafaciens]|uniref:ABC transporter substrate-binding protein n=1 Tax=Paenarthrobacter ureafaciens TaxID=37931 RepID=UPI002DB907EC|nr:ABC transporter substrate-binding protein [Paenarthrobacter ureafaciens]MEC3853139.1 ABC transporter substrate-binding protein [Paenarthrobacter ureafaciens]
MFSRRLRSLPLVAIAATGLALSGCSGGGGSVGAAQPGGSGGSGVFTLGQSAPINNLIPHNFQQSNMTWDRAIYDALVTFEDGKAKPNLAREWTVTPDGRSYTFTLRDNVKFADGKAFDAQVVADNIAWASDPKNIVSGSAVLKAAAVVVNSATSVTLTFPTATPQLLDLLAVVPMMDLTADLATKPNGTGPYKLDSFVPNSALTLTRNDDYWNAEAKPKASGYTVKVFSDNASAQAALSSGQIQALAFPAFNQISALKSAGNKIVSADAPGNFMLRVNVKAGPLADQKVRQALSKAIDRAAFVKVGTADQSQATCSAYPPGSGVYEPSADDNCKYDLEAAKQLLTEAGYSQLTLSVDTSSVRQPELAAYMPILQEQLASIGVTLKINDLTATVMSQNVTTSNYELSTDWYPWGNADPALLFISRTWTPDMTFQNFVDPAYTAMVSAAQGEMDPAKRKALYSDLNEYLMEQSFVIPIATRPYVYAVSPKASGFEMDPLGMVDATSLSTN